jgi:hypothetical protein
MNGFPWRARHFDGGYSAEYLPDGGSVWRIVKHAVDGRRRVKVFPSVRQAEIAAQRAYLDDGRGKITSTVEIPDDIKEARMAEKFAAEAESWLKSSRQDKQAATAIHKPGRKQVIVMRGRS